MELPHLGQHCSVKTCNRLDFLPVKCDSCAAVLCKNHIKYDEHHCPSAHIDRDCKSDPALKKRQRIYSYKCSLISCKQREAVEVKCDKCLKTFCLKHRFPDDHRCQGFENTGRVMNLAGAAALERTKKTNMNVFNTQKSNNATAVDDDESLALAIKLSLNQTAQEENDFLLAQALQQEEEEARRNHATPMVTTSNHSDQKKDKKTCCSIQ